MNESLIKVFKAVEIKNQQKKKCPKSLLERTINSGFIFAPEVISNYSENELNVLTSLVEKYFGLNAKQLNAGFHKSWRKVATASIEQLVFEQIIHYITTYGFEALGIYNENNVFVPYEKLEIPELKKNIDFIVIKGYTKDEIKTKLIDFLSSGIALSEETVKDVTNIALNVGLDDNSLELVRNKEVKMAFYEYLGLIPTNPTEFLRFLIYKSIAKTLLIKDKATIELIKNSKVDVLPIFKRYENSYGLEKLSEIFYRFKPLFLAFRANNAIRPTINKLSKLAIVNHKPMPEDLLNNVTAQLDNKNHKNLLKALENANFFRKARLAHALNFRTNSNDSIMYRIRNGKSFATSFKFNKFDKARQALKIVNQSISKHFIKYDGKTVYIPKNINYALPTTEKQFIGAIPSGSSVTIQKDMVLGVNWNNVNGQRIDLDLSLLSIDGKFGWDGMYRGGYGRHGQDTAILFSGDMTDANGEHGATEAFYLNKQNDGVFLLVLNYFNHNDKIEVPFKLFVASENVKDFNKNYLVNPNNVICSVNSKINTKQEILGLLTIDNNESKFTFIKTAIGGAISSRNSDYMNHSRQFITNYFKNQLNLRDYLVDAGAKIINTPKDCDINLSPSVLEKDTLLNLV